MYLNLKQIKYLINFNQIQYISIIINLIYSNNFIHFFKMIKFANIKDVYYKIVSVFMLLYNISEELSLDLV